ncbi:cell division protein FtsX [Gluconacetobacter entanii]|uniref:cell division protein FtsX n=2 Tax=Gluconacetobacter entanii TaxID=108528 RepID=UPI00223694E1|nr:FtsX-like permease family protein [Gluconacetobacter entanii]MCW4580300.1 cell division protein FtsX [Gluconacetobacter entanii]MCW4583634.1 cell division protein FtsX [Gluconacetobacter entanii]MCW4586976.1 cell division protein FtsX [Gluconacetobacter entanii]
MALWPGTRRRDGLALRQAIPDRLLPFLVGAMAFLAALALAGGIGAHALSARWTHGAGAVVTVQVPDPDAPATGTPGTAVGNGATTRIQAAMATLSAAAGDDPGAVHRLTDGELRNLLAPWIEQGSDLVLPMPAVIEVHARDAHHLPDDVMRTLQAQVPGIVVEHDSIWSDRLAALADSLQTCALLAIFIVIAVSAVVIMAATRAGLQARRRAIDLIHSLGATDGYIAARFAWRVGTLALLGGACGSVLAMPVLVVLCLLAAPFNGADMPDMQAVFSPAAWNVASATQVLGVLPSSLLAMLGALPVGAAALGWVTTQMTVRAWLRRLP